MTAATPGTGEGKQEKKQPILFIGHGNPMNAIQENAFSHSLARLGSSLKGSKAILCISAHWMTNGTWVTRMEKPRTIHDFHGFPKPLFEVQYPAPGSLELADLICLEIKKPKMNADDTEWGLDHGTWAILKYLFPKADIPVVQLSIDMTQDSEFHFRLGQDLRFLRDQGILIIGSGNIVHNLRQVDFSAAAKPYAWAIDFDEWVKDCLIRRDFSSLLNQAMESKAGKLSIPTPDHWYPFLYILGASLEEDSLRFEYEGIDHASISMRSFSYGLA